MKRERQETGGDTDKRTCKCGRGGAAIFWLPREIWEHVISFLHPTKDRWRVSLVCKAWNDLAWDALDPSANDHETIAAVSWSGRAETVRRLLLDKRVDLDYACNMAMWNAVFRWFKRDKFIEATAGKFYRELGNPDVHEIRNRMRDNPPPPAYGNWAFAMACMVYSLQSEACDSPYNLKIVSLLLDDPCSPDHTDEHLKIVRLLLDDAHLNPVDRN